MKFWVAQDDNGLIHLFSKEPKRAILPYANIHVWYADDNNCVTIELNNEFNSERYISNEDKHVEHRFLADILGFKRKGYYTKAKIIKYEGIYTKEAREVEIEFNIKLIKPKF